MKRFAHIALAVAMLFIAIPASAQISFGPKIGVAIDHLSFSKDAFLSSDNRVGFTGGLTLEAMIPAVNLGLDASLMYVHHTADVKSTDTTTPNGGSAVTEISRNYIEIPVHLKWKIGLPIIGKIITPYVFTGPNFAFLASKKAISDAFHNKSFDTVWDFGAGVQLFSKLQIGASYDIGMTKALKAIGLNGETTTISGRNKYWTVTAAWMF